MHVSRNRQTTRDIWGRRKGGRVGWVQRKSNVPPQTARKTITRSRLYATSFSFLRAPTAHSPGPTPHASPERNPNIVCGVKRPASSDLEKLSDWNADSSESSEWEVEVSGEDVSPGRCGMSDTVVVLDLVSSENEEDDERNTNE